MLAASPSTALAECWLLTRLSSEPAFQKAPRVFSYHWAEDRSRRIFRNPIRAYEAFNRSIAESIRAVGDNAVATIVDAKSFYPSLGTDGIRDGFAARLETSSLSLRERRRAIALVDGYLAASVKLGGLGLGSPLSHVLADIAMEATDRRLTEHFGDRYSRYVDDIVIVTRASEADEAFNRVQAHLAVLGLAINSAKSDVVPAIDWLSHAPTGFSGGGPRTYETLERRIENWIARGGDVDTLSQALRGEGMHFPLAGLLRRSRVARVANLARSLWHGSILPDSPSRLAALARDVRNSLLTEMHLRLSSTPSTVTRTRWWESRIRYCANRLLFLLPRGQLGPMADALVSVPGCHEVRVVINAIVSGSLGGLLDYHGTATAIAALLAPSFGLRPIEFDELALTSDQRSAVADLALAGLARTDGQLTDRVLRFSLGMPTDLFREGEISFEDEIGALLQGSLVHEGGVTGAEMLGATLHTRLSFHEQWHLDMFGLGGDYE